ncbi:MAG: hypothetical protein QOE72_378 [Chloroflexota bacterium]|jgi:hypothetical protein|nr:hypothetical protein [Chloroflexota bacterium]
MRRVSIGIGVLVAVIGLCGCGGTRADITPAGSAGPVRVEPVPGTARQVVVLTDAGAARLGITTEATRPVMSAADGDTATATDQSLLPVAAILYDSNGATWTYTMTGPLAYERVPVTVVRVEGGQAVVQPGPAVGTQVVTVGGAELLGAEDGIAGD